MTLYCGTSGFAYEQWKGLFYPSDLPAARMLEHYGTKLNSVEINNTFYRMPKSAVIAAWREQVPAGFRFAVKASRRISHFKRLKGCESEAQFLFDNLAELGSTLGAVLVQLPPNLPIDLPRLEAFLELIPAGLRVAFEFRHASWNDVTVHRALGAVGAAWVAVDRAGEAPKDAPGEQSWGYARLRAAEYSERVLADWAGYGRELDPMFVFFKHEDDAAGPAMAARLQALAE